jgi:hypothetical protein
MRHEAGMDLEQLTGLAEPLPSVPQEGVHFAVQREHVAQDLPRGDLCVHLSEVGRSPVYLLDGGIGCVGGGNPRSDCAGVVRGAIGRGVTGARRLSGMDRIRCALQPEASVEQFVPFGQLMVTTLPAADHPDQSVVRGDRLASDTTELSCRLRHVPPARPAPFAQRPAINTGHGAYLRVALHIREHGSVLPSIHSCSQVSLSHDRSLPVNWIRHVGMRW